MAKSKYSASEKLKIIKKYEEGFYTVLEVAELSVTIVKNGCDSIVMVALSPENRDGWTKYPRELKIQAIHVVLEGRESLMSAILKYNISGKSVLAR